MNKETKAVLQAILDGKQIETQDMYGDWQESSPELGMYKIGAGLADKVRIKDKFAELKQAYRNGAVIEFKTTRGIWDSVSSVLGPMWNEYTEYRVKPEPKPDYSKFVGVGINDLELSHTTGVYGEKRFVPMEFETVNRIQYKTTDVLELVYNGETKKLKDVIIHGVN
jgi:hypothetical protein